MKRALLAGMLMAAITLGAHGVSAASLSVDVPVAFTLGKSYFDSYKGSKPKDGKTTTDVSGFILGASAGWLGVGYEQYDVNFKGKAPGGGGGFDATMSYQLYDVFLDLPFPVLHPVIGYGKGLVNPTVKVGGPSTKIEAADVSQFFVRVGWAIGPLLDLHLGYHQLTAEDAKIKGGGGPPGDKFLASGETWTVGLRAGW